MAHAQKSSFLLEDIFLYPFSEERSKTIFCKFLIKKEQTIYNVHALQE